MDKDDVKSRIFTFQRNYDFETHDKDEETGKQSVEATWDISEADWRKSVIADIEKYETADEVWLIFHNKDLDEEGQPKKLHAHGVILNNSTTYFRSNTLAKALNVNNSNGKQLTKVRKESGVFRYLTHTSDQAMKDKKYRYGIDELHYFKHGIEVTDREEVRADYTKHIAGNEVKEKDNVAAFGDDLVGQVAMNNMTFTAAKEWLQEKYGIKGITWLAKNLRSFDNAMRLRREIEVAQAKERPRKLSLVFVYGVSNVGKTHWTSQFAKYVAQRENMEMTRAIYESPTTKNDSVKDYYFLSTYDNQPITIIDDVSPTAFEYNNFLKIFDDNKIVTIRNRNKDKAWLSEKCFMIKSTASPTDFFKEIYEDEVNQHLTERENIIKQVTRRVSWIIKVEKDCIKVHKNDDGFLNGKKTISFKYSQKMGKKEVEAVNEELYNLLYK